jgi:hypothetical protein
LLLWLIETDVFQMPQLHKHLNVSGKQKETMHILTTSCLPILSLLTFFVNPKQTRPTMGMSYEIIPNKQTKCVNDFGNGLSFFFEQVEGYGENAEVEQVSQILKVDLSVFQDVNYNYENKTDVDTHWHDLNTLTQIVDTLIARIIAHPEYYKKVIHNPEKAKHDELYSKILVMKDTAKANILREQIENSQFYYYPGDYGYLSEGRLLKDLQTLKSTLDCYKRNSVTKVRFQYT